MFFSLLSTLIVFIQQEKLILTNSLKIMCLYLSLAAVFTQNKAIQISLNQETSFYHAVCVQIYSDPFSWEREP